MIWKSDDRFGYPTWCDLEIHERPDGKRVFIATELVLNPGRCITNNPVKIANEVRQHFALKAKDMIWIEHYPRRQRCGAADDWLAECYEVVRLSANRRGEFISAEPKRAIRQQVDQIISGRLQIAELFPTRQPNGAQISKPCPSSRRSSPAKAVAPRADHF